MSTSSKLHLAVMMIVSLLLVLIWFHGGLIEGGGEEGLPFYNPVRTYQLSKSVWWDYDGGFPTLAWLPKITFLLPSSILFETVHIPNFFLQMLTFFILLSVGELSLYYLTLNLINENYQYRKNIIFIAAIFYIFNPYSMSQIWGRGLASQYFSFALLPLSSLIFLLGLKSKNYFYLLAFVLSSLIFSSAFGLSTFVVTFWVVLFSIFIYWTTINIQNLKEIIFASIFFISSLFLWVFINLWWFLPIIISGDSIYFRKLNNAEENIGTLLGVSRNFTPDIIIRLLQRTYFFDPSAFSPIYSSLIFQLMSWLIPAFLIIGLIAIIKKREFRRFKFFVLLFVLGLVVSLGANLPGGPLFIWIFKHSSFLQAFRNPYEKFGIVYSLAYSPIFALGLVYFFEQRFKNWKAKTLGITVILILICGIFAWPMWTGRVIAGPDKKIGIDVPTYYRDLQHWLSERDKDYRLFMTPLWSGDGAFYQWGKSGRYQGLDPMIYLLHQPSISNTLQAPFYYDFITSVRKYMERMDVAPALSLLRAKFLVDRKDAIFVTDREKNHYKFLTSLIYPPKGVESELKTICQNMTVDAKSNGTAWIVCQIPPEFSDLSNIRYLHVKVKTDVPANLEVALRDTKEIRIRWDGRADLDYHTDTNNWQYITIPLSTPTEYNSAIDLSKSLLLEVLAHPKDSPQQSVGKINISEIKLDPGTEKQINEFRLVSEFGKLSIFEPVNFNPSPEFGNLSLVQQVKNFIELFDQANQKRDLINILGFMLPSQNTNKDFGTLVDKASVQVIDKQKISDTRYWLKVAGNSGYGLIILSKTFNPEWKLLRGVSKEELKGGLFNDLSILKKVSVDESNHYVVNGYANLWKIESGESEYAIVFIPQVVADIGLKISALGVSLLFGVGLIWVIKRYISSP